MSIVQMFEYSKITCSGIKLDTGEVPYDIKSQNEIVNVDMFFLYFTV